MDKLNFIRLGPDFKAYIKVDDLFDMIDYYYDEGITDTKALQIAIALSLSRSEFTGNISKGEIHKAESKPTSPCWPIR